MSDIALCLACGEPVFFNDDGQMESADGPDCRSRQGGHLVKQVMPDPEGQA